MSFPSGDEQRFFVGACLRAIHNWKSPASRLLGPSWLSSSGKRMGMSRAVFRTRKKGSAGPHYTRESRIEGSLRRRLRSSKESHYVEPIAPADRKVARPANSNLRSLATPLHACASNRQQVQSAKCDPICCLRSAAGGGLGASGIIADVGQRKILNIHTCFFFACFTSQLSKPMGPLHRQGASMRLTTVVSEEPSPLVLPPEWIFT